MKTTFAFILFGLSCVGLFGFPDQSTPTRIIAILAAVVCGWYLATSLLTTYRNRR